MPKEYKEIIKTTKPKREMSQYNMPKDQAERELASKVMTFNLELMQLGSTKPETPELLGSRFQQYFSRCAEVGLPPTVEGLALISGWCRSEFFDISAGKVNTKFTDTIKRAKDYVCNYDAGMASIGKVNAPVYIFRAKNFYDMKDVQQVEVAPNVQADVPKNADDLLETLPEAPGEGTFNVDSKTVDI